MFGKMKEAKSPFTNYITLREHGASKNKKLRAAVAANPNLQAYMMEIMAEDLVENVRVALATNPKINLKSWNILSEDSSIKVRESLKEHHPESPEAKDPRKEQ